MDHKDLFQVSSDISSDIIELRPQRRLRVCIINCKEAASSIGLRSDVNGDVTTGLSGVTTFLLHGVGGSLDVWQAQFNILRRSDFNRIVACDLIGHGLSAAPRLREEYQFEEIALDVISLFSRFRGEKNVIIGHSYGCRFAALLAHQYSELISKLVLISIGAPVPLYPHPGFLRLSNCCLICLRPVLVSTFMRHLFHHRERGLTQSIVVPPSYVLKYTMLGQLWLQGDKQFYAAIDTDTLLIHGRHDRLVSSADTELMHETMQHSQLKIIEDAGHMVMMEQPEQLNKCLHDFLSTLSPSITTAIAR